MAEVRSRSIEQQADFWWQALRGRMLWLSKLGTTTEWDRLTECGVYEIPWMASTTARLTNSIIAEAEAQLSVEFPTPPERKTTESLLMELFALEHYSDLQAQVQEESINRLHRLLQRLYEDSKKRDRIGSAVQLTARALHALRPERFPTVRFTGDRENPNRLREPERFGLE